jgi:type I restriction-modification system DNA methylase subunit
MLEAPVRMTSTKAANILYLVVSKFCDVDLHPNKVPNQQMGLIFENLIRRFNELANETAGDHFTPREVIRLMVNILFINDDPLLATPGTVRKLLDPTCGTGGMLAESQNYLREHHSAAKLFVHGQDYNKRAFATAASDMLMKQVDHNGGVDTCASATASPMTSLRARPLTTCSPIRPSVWIGRSSMTRSRRSTTSVASPAASVPVCRV